MQLKKLLRNIENITIKPNENLSIDIQGLCCDFKKCQPKFLYAAFTGETVDSDHFGKIIDGRIFINQSIEKGAIAILTDKHGLNGQLQQTGITYIVHPDPTMVFSKMAANFFENEQPTHMVCVTGTNGKTSTVNFCRQLWNLLGKNSASIGNLGTISGNGELLWQAIDPFSVPVTVVLYEMLKNLKSRGIEYVAIEATSHALFESRLSGVVSHIAAFTSFSRDHLDFHQTMAEYFNIKMKLFDELLQKPGYAIINADMSEFEEISKRCIARGINVIGYGYHAAEITLLSIDGNFQEQKISFRIHNKIYNVTLPFPGQYQVKNILCAIGILMASGLTIEQIVTQIPKLQPIQGRMQKVTDHNGGQIFIDFAHTDDGLRTTLKNIKAMALGRVLLVFGAGGNRDTGKRPLMGKVAATYADLVVITDDDPRTEDPESIRYAIAKTCPGAHIIGDRKEAIRFAINVMQKNDVLVVTGKGNDNGQIIGDKIFPFSDYDTILEITTN